MQAHQQHSKHVDHLAGTANSKVYAKAVLANNTIEFASRWSLLKAHLRWLHYASSLHTLTFAVVCMGTVAPR